METEGAEGKKRKPPKNAFPKGQEAGPGRPKTTFSEWGLIEDMRRVTEQAPTPHDSVQLKACRKLFKEDYKGYLNQYEKLLRAETEAKKAETARKASEREAKQEAEVEEKRAAVAAGGQEVRVEELIAGLLQEMKS